MSSWDSRLCRVERRGERSVRADVTLTLTLTLTLAVCQRTVTAAIRAFSDLLLPRVCLQRRSVTIHCSRLCPVLPRPFLCCPELFCPALPTPCPICPLPCPVPCRYLVSFTFCSYFLDIELPIARRALPCLDSYSALHSPALSCRIASSFCLTASPVKQTCYGPAGAQLGYCFA